MLRQAESELRIFYDDVQNLKKSIKMKPMSKTSILYFILHASVILIASD